MKVFVLFETGTHTYIREKSIHHRERRIYHVSRGGVGTVGIVQRYVTDWGSMRPVPHAKCVASLLDHTVVNTVGDLNVGLSSKVG